MLTDAVALPADYLVLWVPILLLYAHVSRVDCNLLIASDTLTAYLFFPFSKLSSLS